jgi:hypothetical protein
MPANVWNLIWVLVVLIIVFALLRFLFQVI